MAKYLDGDIRTVDHTAGGTPINVDDVVVLGTGTGKKVSVGVAVKNIPANAMVENAVAVTGVFRFPKVSADVIAAGNAVNYVLAAGEVGNNAAVPGAGGVTEFGRAVTSPGAGAVEVDVEINSLGVLA